MGNDNIQVLCFSSMKIFSQVDNWWLDNFKLGFRTMTRFYFFFMASFSEFRQKNAGKKARAAKEKEVKKRKMEEEAPRKSGSGEMDEDEEDQDVTHDD